MKIKFYGSKLCPRCYLARRALRDICDVEEQREIEEIEVLLHPKRTWQADIRMIPALQVEEATLSGIYLSASHIYTFIRKFR